MRLQRGSGSLSTIRAQSVGTDVSFSSLSQPGTGGQPLYSTLTSGPILLRRLSRIDHQLLPDSYLFRAIELAPRTLRISLRLYHDVDDLRDWIGAAIAVRSRSSAWWLAGGLFWPRCW